VYAAVVAAKAPPGHQTCPSHAPRPRSPVVRAPVQANGLLVDLAPLPPAVVPGGPYDDPPRAAPSSYVPSATPPCAPPVASEPSSIPNNFAWLAWYDYVFRYYQHGQWELERLRLNWFDRLSAGVATWYCICCKDFCLPRPPLWSPYCPKCCACDTNVNFCPSIPAPPSAPPSNFVAPSCTVAVAYAGPDISMANVNGAPPVPGLVDYGSDSDDGYHSPDVGAPVNGAPTHAQFANFLATPDGLRQARLVVAEHDGARRDRLRPEHVGHDRHRSRSRSPQQRRGEPLPALRAPALGARSGLGAHPAASGSGLYGSPPQSGLPQFSDGAVHYAPPRHAGEVLPPEFTHCNLHNRAVQSYLHTVGSVKSWDEKSDRPEYAMQWLDSVLHMATVANVDFGRILRSRLSLKGQQWLSALLPMHTYAHWVSDNYAPFKDAFREHYAHQSRPDSDLAADIMFDRGLSMGSLSLDAYADQFHQLARRLLPGTLTPYSACKLFLKGMSAELKPKCLTAPGGHVWTNLDDLISHARYKYRKMRLEYVADTRHGRHGQTPYPRHTRPHSAAAHVSGSSLKRASNTRGRGGGRGQGRGRSRVSFDLRSDRDTDNECPPTVAAGQAQSRGPAPSAGPSPRSGRLRTDADPSLVTKAPTACRSYGVGLTANNSKQARTLSHDEERDLRLYGLCCICRGTQVVAGRLGRHPGRCPWYKSEHVIAGPRHH